MKDRSKVIYKSKEYNFMSKNWKCFLCRTRDIPNKYYTYQLTGEIWSYEELVFRCIKLDPDFLLAYNVLQDICKYHNGIVGNHRLKMLVSNDSFSFCYNLIMEEITSEKRYL